MVRNESDSSPLDDPGVGHAAAEAVRKAHAVGLVEDRPDFAGLTYAVVRRVVQRVREAGIGDRAAGAFARADPGDTATLARELRAIDTLLEESPLPATEWHRLLGIFDREQLARLVGVSPSSAVRYASGARRTPDDVAARLHLIALVTGDLAGAYNDIGVRRWFERRRTALDGRAPADLLAGDWKPEDPGPRRVRDLARALVAPGAT